MGFMDNFTSDSPVTVKQGKLRVALLQIPERKGGI